MNILTKWLKMRREPAAPPAPVVWTEWHGGDCPLPWDCPVHIRTRDGHEHGPLRAGRPSWRHFWNSPSDIVAYRVVP